MRTSKYPNTRYIVKHIRTLNKELPKVEEHPNVPGEEPRQMVGLKHILAARNIISSIMDANEELLGINHLSDVHRTANREEVRIIRNLDLPDTVKMNITKIFQAILDPKNSQLEFDSELQANDDSFQKLSEQITSFKEKGLLKKLGIKL